MREYPTRLRAKFGDDQVGGSRAIANLPSYIHVEAKVRTASLLVNSGHTGTRVRQTTWPIDLWLGVALHDTTGCVYARYEGARSIITGVAVQVASPTFTKNVRQPFGWLFH